MSQILQSYSSILSKVPKHVQLIAVSKFQPLSSLVTIALGGASDRVVFGENYVQELVQKASEIDEAIATEMGNESAVVVRPPADVGFAFIGGLQTNKIATLLQCPRLCEIHSLASLKHVTKLLSLLTDPVSVKCHLPLAVYLQINTSGEESKSGFVPLPVDEAPAANDPLVVAARALADADPSVVRLAGLMTIGKLGAPSPLPDFELLRQQRDQLAQLLDCPAADLGLSMGMSSDFEQAIEAGASVVRVGSSIFGARPPKAT